MNSFSISVTCTSTFFLGGREHSGLAMRNVPLIGGAGNEPYYELQRERVLKCGTGVNALVRLFNGFYFLV